MARNTVVVAAALLLVAVIGAAKTINYVPMFDFDANLLKTDAKVCIVHKEGNQWVPMNVCRRLPLFFSLVRDMCACANKQKRMYR